MSDILLQELIGRSTVARLGVGEGRDRHSIDDDDTRLHAIHSFAEYLMIRRVRTQNSRGRLGVIVRGDCGQDP
ncbi:hypothetical protein [Streptomyces sp. CG 926]|uniref:hypothetical protein n=1 Tax=Streptomyces sp. CG 926 TaxID=1882405 RepID=UPI0011B641EB|nr:hypothetical protein [Streptomyces sp. CG 926]